MNGVADSGIRGVNSHHGADRGDQLSHGEALRKSILAMIGDTQRPERAHPKYWAPFVVVGEPAKTPNKKRNLKACRRSNLTTRECLLL
jgi:hypothetical protein